MEKGFEIKAGEYAQCSTLLQKSLDSWLLMELQRKHDRRQRSRVCLVDRGTLLDHDLHDATSVDVNLLGRSG